MTSSAIKERGRTAHRNAHFGGQADNTKVRKLGSSLLGRSSAKRILGTQRRDFEPLRDFELSRRINELVKAHAKKVKPSRSDAVRFLDYVYEVLHAIVSSAPPVALEERVDRLQAEPSSAVQLSGGHQESIGVYSSSTVHDRLTAQSAVREVPMAQVAREAFEAGLAVFESRVWDENPQAVIEDMRSKVLHVQDRKKKLQWSLRLDRKKFLRVVALSEEFELSRSEFALICIAFSLAVSSAKCNGAEDI